MKKLVAVLCLSMVCVLAAASPPAEARVLGVYPDQIKDWPINWPAPSFSWGEFLGSATGAQFMYPLRLPVGARVTELRAWTRHNNTGTGWVRLIGVKDGTYYEEATDDLARVYLDDGPPGEWYQACELIYAEGSTEAFWRADALLTALERLKFGVTTGVTFFGGGDSVMRTDDPRYGDAHLVKPSRKSACVGSSPSVPAGRRSRGSTCSGTAKRRAT